MYNKLEDARELSAKINACSRAGKPEAAIGFTMENQESKKRAESIHVKYKQQLISGIKYSQETEKIIGQGYVILNAQNKIKDTMIGTIASIMANIPSYEKGTIIIGMAYDENNKIKISARNAKRQGRNVRELLTNVMNNFEGDVGGHQFAAGCLIPREKEQEFIDILKKQLEIQIVKIVN